MEYVVEFHVQVKSRTDPRADWGDLLGTYEDSIDRANKMFAKVKEMNEGKNFLRLVRRTKIETVLKEDS